MDARTELNRKWWNNAAPVHAGSRFYDVDSFRDGKLTLNPIEREIIGDVNGKSLLHLQCHFGMDTLSWARLGADATGVDFSENAIEIARGLNEEIGQDARFVCSDVYKLPDVLDEQFDIVYTALGVLTWLPDIRGWARVVANHLKPGGMFFLMDSHTFRHMLDDAGPDPSGTLRVVTNYWDGRDGTRYSGDEPSYGSGGVVIEGDTWEWQHTISDIISAILAAGLSLTSFNEYPFTVYKAFPGIERCDDGWYRTPPNTPDVPLLYSLTATK